MMSENEIVVFEKPRILSLGALPTTGPVALIQQASQIATELAKIIKDRRLTSKIQGRDFVQVEGWSTMGAMLGVLPREVETNRLEDGGYEAIVELIRINDNAVIGRASALCGMDEKDSKGKPTWANRPEYARRSMAVTRATGKAYRLGFSWIMALAGYEPTPAEEMIEGDFTVQKSPRQTRPGTTPAPEPPDDAGSNGTHWIDKTDSAGVSLRVRFWAWTDKQTLTREQVYQALGVKSVHDYVGTMDDARAAIEKWIAEQAAAVMAGVPA